MTEQEAIELLGIIKDVKYYKHSDGYIAIDMAIEALEKQIPKKPWRQADDDTCVYYHYECINCGNYMGHYHTKGTYSFCPDCGQRLKWEDEE